MPQRSLLYRSGPPLVPLAAYWISVVVLVRQSMTANQGHLAYALDDPYIHMAMAKNVALHGVWGMTAEGFSSTSSSPLWTALVALIYRVVGVHDMVPLVLNLIFGSLCIAAAYRVIRRTGGTPAWAGGVTLASVFASALPTLAITGMEHTLHAWLTLALATAAVTVVSTGRTSLRQAVAVTALAAALTAARYEGLFTIVALAGLLAVCGKRRMAALVTVAGLAPALIYGTWSLAQGWYFLPNPVLLKGAVPAADAFAVLKVLIWWNGINALQLNPHVLILVVLSLVALLYSPGEWSTKDRVTLNVIFLGTTLLHAEFAKFGWFYRYEAYLLLLGLTALGATAGPVMGALVPPWRAGAAIGRRITATMLVVVLSAPLALRAFRALASTVGATTITYDQQYQMGQFLARYYPGRTIAVNDIGAVSYFGDITLLDLVGLASLDVAGLRRAGHFNREHVGDLSRLHHAAIAIVYDNWLAALGGVPAGWRKVGEWTGSVPDSTVAFYAVAPDEAEALSRNLKAFAAHLPPRVTATVAASN